MILKSQRLIRSCAALAGIMGVAACSQGFDDSKSLAALKSANEGAVFIKVTYSGRPCRVGNIALATEPSPGRFMLHSTPMLGGINSSGLNSRQLSLPAGTYHVGYVQCMLDDGGQTTVVGEHDGTIQIGNPRQSLAHFTVAAGEVVNVGQLNLVPTDYLAKSTAISITDIDAASMGRLRNGVPTLSSTMVTRLMSDTAPGQTYKVSWVQMGGG
jgi:hypothetical protein